MDDKFFYGYSRAIINSIAAVMNTKMYDHEKTKTIESIISVSNLLELPADLYSFNKEADE